jgi:SAM-dependent methyltransferase
MRFWTRWARSKSAVARALNLDLTHSQKRYAALLKPFVVSGVRWQELGCGRCIFPDWAMSADEQRELASRCASLVGLDVDSAMLEHPLLSARVIGLGGQSPFRDGIFDLISANNVVEHVEDVPAFLADVYRQLSPGGRFVFHTPNARHYLVFLARRSPEWLKARMIWWLDRRQEKDRFFTYYRLNTERSVREMAAQAGFEVEYLRVVGSTGMFWRLGPLGPLECFILKATATIAGGKFDSNVLCTLRKPLAAAARRG